MQIKLKLHIQDNVLSCCKLGWSNQAATNIHSTERDNFDCSDLLARDQQTKGAEGTFHPTNHSVM